MQTTIALVGNQNSGKTTLFNQLTGNHQYVGNWPGVTVERKEGTLRGNKEVRFVDLPGIYSLSPYSSEEVIARTFLSEGNPDVIIDIVDATNLERNLYLTNQLMEFGVPVVVALNMMDVVEKRKIQVDSEALSKHLGVPVVEISALKGTNKEEVVDVAVKAAADKKLPEPVKFSPQLEKYLDQIEALLPDDCPDSLRRYYTIKLFENDQKAVAELSSIPDVSSIVAKATQEFDDIPESIITDARYQSITGYISDVLVKDTKSISTSQKIDKVLTNRILALPIFIVIIGLIYFISVSTVGGYVTDWANDGLFGDGWHITGGAAYEEACEEYDRADAIVGAAEDGETTVDIEDEDGEVAETVAITPAVLAEAQETLDQYLPDADDAEAVAEYDRADAIAAAVEEGEESIVYDGETIDLSDEETITDAEDVLASYEPDPADFGIWVPGIPVLVEQFLDWIHCAGWLESLIIDGIIAGVGAVLGFVPQIMILFFLLAILEGCGYMSRVAFMLDRIFRRFGLSGKSFIPYIIGTGCGVPGILATRTIESESSRRLTVMTTTMMPCSAKVPLIALFAGAIFGGAWWVAPFAYFLGIAVILCAGVILKKTRPFLGKTAPFVMELPDYRLPRFVDLLRSMWERAWTFIKKAFTVIAGAAILIWFLSTYGWEDGVWCAVDNMDNSILGIIGGAIARFFYPLGWGNWQAAAASLSGLLAKENIVATFGILYGAGEVSENGHEVWLNLAANYGTLAGLSLMVFNLLSIPCFASLACIRREMNSAKWFWATIGFELLTAYTVSLWIYQLGMWFTTGVFGVWTVVAIAAAIAFLILLFRPYPKRLEQSALEAAAAEA